MKIYPLIAASALALAITLPSTSFAAPSEPGDPIISLMPHVKELRADLNLSPEQSKTIDDWLNEAPKKRQQLEKETLEVRAKLRKALLDRAPRLEREALKSELAEKNNRLIEMRSLCARMLNKTLTKAQYEKVVAAYKQSH